MRFKDKVAIVTGAGGGIGEAYAHALAGEGCAVVVAEANRDTGEAVAAAIRGDGGQAVCVQTDVADPASAEACAAAACQAFGGVDYLINNAAIYGGMKMSGLLGVEWDYYLRFMAVNMHGALAMTRAVHGQMAARGGGAIVNGSSSAAYSPSNYYGLAKLGLNGLTAGLARELGPKNIRVNGVAPGPIDTAATRTTVPAPRIESIVAGLPLKRMGQPADIAAVALFLLSDEASWITGQTWCVDGGMVSRPG